MAVDGWWLCWPGSQRQRQTSEEHTKLVPDTLSDTWEKLLRLMIIMESDRQITGMYLTFSWAV